MLNGRPYKSRGLEFSFGLTESEHGGLRAKRSAHGVCCLAEAKNEEKEEEEEESPLENYNRTPNCTSCTFRISSLVPLLKSCAKQKDINQGSRIHAGVIKNGLFERDIYVSTSLINMYAKCGALTKAEQVFDQIPVQNAVSWNALIAGYAQHGHAEEALHHFEQMRANGPPPDAVTFVSMLQACGSLGASLKGQEIHAEILREGFLNTNVVVANALIDMYARIGLLTKAQEVLDKLPVSDVISWTALITGYSESGCGEEAFKCYEQMRTKGVSPNMVTFLCVLKACGSIEAVDKGQEIHAEMVRKGLLEEDVSVSNALIDMYVKCGFLEEARDVFEKLPTRDAVSWNALIAGYVQHGHNEEALECFEEMRETGPSPDAVTFACILKACGSTGSVEKGEDLHEKILDDGLLEKDIIVGTSLVDMYASCGILARAQEVFDRIPFRNVVLWTALITGYAHHGHVEEALACFETMQLHGFIPDAVTYVCILQACGSIRAAKEGHKLHTRIVREGVLEKEITVGTALVDMYISCGRFVDAREVFEKFTARDVVSWNVMITRFVQCSHVEEALNFFNEMRSEGHLPDPVTYACTLKACGNLGAAYKGQEVHADIVLVGLLELDTVLVTSLLDMYANCSMIEEAQQVFDKLSTQDLVSWTVLMAGYAQLGMEDVVFVLFDRMVREGKEPNLLTFTILLNACTHTGLLDKGQMCFETVPAVFGLVPTSDHFNCMINLLSHAGQSEKVVVLTQEMPFVGDLTMWHTLLGVCQIVGDMRLGKLAFEHATQLDEMDAAAYVCMGNIYAASCG